MHSLDTDLSAKQLRTERNWRNLSENVEQGVAIDVHQIITTRLLIIGEKLDMVAALKHSPIFWMKLEEITQLPLCTWMDPNLDLSSRDLGPGISVRTQGLVGSCANEAANWLTKRSEMTRKLKSVKCQLPIWRLFQTTNIEDQIIYAILYLQQKSTNTNSKFWNSWQIWTAPCSSWNNKLRKCPLSQKNV